LTPIAHIGAGVVGAFLLDTFIFHRPLSTETLALAAGLSLLPDLDTLAVAALKRNRSLKERNDHHTSFSHTPLFYLGLALILALFLPQRIVAFFGILSLLHLGLDSWATDDGIMWLWPHSNQQYALLPIPIRDDDIYGWRYYRHHYLQERRQAAWTEIGLGIVGLGLTLVTILPLITSTPS
jgi:hypothetical protein